MEFTIHTREGSKQFDYGTSDTMRASACSVLPVTTRLRIGEGGGDAVEDEGKHIVRLLESLMIGSYDLVPAI